MNNEKALFNLMIILFIIGIVLVKIIYISM